MNEFLDGVLDRWLLCDKILMAYCINLVRSVFVLIWSAGPPLGRISLINPPVGVVLQPYDRSINVTAPPPILPNTSFMDHVLMWSGLRTSRTVSGCLMREILCVYINIRSSSAQIWTFTSPNTSFTHLHPFLLFSSYHPSSSLSFLLRMTHNLSPSHHVGVSSFLVSFSSPFLSFSLSFGNQSDLIDGLCSNLGQRINRRKDYPYSATLMLSHMTTTGAKQINKQTMHADRSKSPCLYLTRSPASLRAKTWTDGPVFKNHFKFS